MDAKACRFEDVSTHVDRFTPDDRTDRPNLGAVHGSEGTLLVEGGASPAHLSAFVAELERRGRPPIVAVALTHWHWDHSFGAAALDVPLIAHEATARELVVQAGYDWSDEALDERVRDGREIAFCADMIRLELPDRSDLRIAIPSELLTVRRLVDLGDVEAIVEHVGGDHAADSCVVHVPADGALFLGDCLYQRLHAPEPLLTVAGSARWSSTYADSTRPSRSRGTPTTSTPVARIVRGSISSRKRSTSSSARAPPGARVGGRRRRTRRADRLPPRRRRAAACRSGASPSRGRRSGPYAAVRSDRPSATSAPHRSTAPHRRDPMSGPVCRFLLERGLVSRSHASQIASRCS